MRLAPRSLRNQLVLGAIAVGLTFSALFGTAAAWRIHHAEDQAVTAALLSRADLARDEVAADGSLSQDAGTPKTDLVQVLSPDGTIRTSSTALVGIGPLVDIDAARASSHGTQARVALQRPDIDLAALGVPIQLTSNGSSTAGTGALVVAVDVEGFNAATADLSSILIVGLVAVILTMAALSRALTGRALSSVTQLTESAEALGPPELSAGLPIPEQDAELARLVGALNRMLTRLHDAHTTELAFAAEAGHRLRTPVATLRAEAELALRERDPDTLTAALERIVSDADQLTSIVDRMLARSRSRNHAPEPIVLALNEAAPRWQRQAELSSLNLSIHIDPQITPRTRSAEVVEIIEPILDNATRYTPHGGRIDINVRLAEGASDNLVVDISNTGSAVSADVETQIFDPWVSTRDASAAGGLGLWLARETARDLGGDVTLVPDRAHGTTFRIELPIRS